MKKEYQKLSMTVVNLDTQLHILAGSETVTGIGGDELDYGGGGSGPARGRSHSSDDWDD